MKVGPQNPNSELFMSQFRLPKQCVMRRCRCLLPMVAHDVCVGGLGGEDLGGARFVTCAVRHCLVAFHVREWGDGWEVRLILGHCRGSARIGPGLDASCATSTAHLLERQV